MNGLNPDDSSISHHDKNSAKFLFHTCISRWSCPNGSGSPDAINGRTIADIISNSQPSTSTFKMSICVWPIFYVLINMSELCMREHNWPFATIKLSSVYAFCESWGPWASTAANPKRWKCVRCWCILSTRGPWELAVSSKAHIWQFRVRDRISFSNEDS